MLYKIAPFIMIIMTTWISALAVIQLLRYRIKRKIIEAGMVDENLVKAILEDNKSHEEKQQNVLKWVFVMGFGGLGLIVQEFLPYNMDESLLPYGVIIVFLSIGLLLYYLATNYLSKKSQ
nr:DUF6249 domain-containing protein [Pedobacter sp. ASV2]